LIDVGLVGLIGSKSADLVALPRNGFSWGRVGVSSPVTQQMRNFSAKEIRKYMLPPNLFPRVRELTGNLVIHDRQTGTAPSLRKLKEWSTKLRSLLQRVILATRRPCLNLSTLQTVGKRLAFASCWFNAAVRFAEALWI
jgi:hypothetical protein